MSATKYTSSGSNFATWKVVDLRKELRARGLSTAGRKAELVHRLSALQAPVLSSPGSSKPDSLRTPPRSVGQWGWLAGGVRGAGSFECGRLLRTRIRTALGGGRLVPQWLLPMAC